MASVVGICNKALILVGAKTITAITENSKEGRLCNTIYETVRDAELRRHPWNFAVKRATLSPSADTPKWGYTYAHELPTDCLRVLGFDYELTYRLEGRSILTNETVVNLRYLAKIQDPNLYTPQFIEVLATKLALEIAYSLEGKANRIDALTKGYTDALRDARFVDATEDQIEQLESSEWEESRR